MGQTLNDQITDEKECAGKCFKTSYIYEKKISNF